MKKENIELQGSTANTKTVVNILRSEAQQYFALCVRGSNVNIPMCSSLCGPINALSFFLLFLIHSL